MVSMCLQGYTFSVFDIVTNGWILDLWREKCNIYMQTLHFSIALGMTIGPFTLAPFVGLDPSKSQTEVENAMIKLNATLGPVSKVKEEITNGTSTVPSISRFSIPFTIYGIAILLSALIQLWLYYFEKRIEEQTRNESIRLKCDPQTVESPKDEVSYTSENHSQVISKKDKRLVLVLGSIILFVYVGMEINIFNFITQFIVYMKIDQKTSVYQATILSASFAFFRLIAILESKVCTAVSLLIIHLSLLIMSCLVLFFLSHISINWMSFGVFLLGGGCSVFFPSTYSMIETLTSLDNQSISILMFMGSLASIFYPLFMLKLLHFDPMFYVYINFMSIFIVGLAIFTLLYKFGANNLTFLKVKRRT